MNNNNNRDIDIRQVSAHWWALYFRPTPPLRPVAFFAYSAETLKERFHAWAKAQGVAV